MLLRSILFALVALFTLQLPSIAQSDERIRVQMSWIPSVQYADHWIAMERDLFAKRGLDVELLTGGPNAVKGPVAVAAGAADIGYTDWQSFLGAIRAGNDYVIIGTPIYYSPMGIISLKNKPIRSVDEVVGKRILVQGPREKNLIETVLRMSNKNASDWTPVPTGYSPEPLLAGDGDGYTGYGTNQVLTIENMGLKRDVDFFFTSFNELGFVEPGEIIFTTRSYLNSHRDSVVKYLAALIEGWKLNVEDPTYAPRIVLEKYGRDLGLDLDQQNRQNIAQLAFRKEPYYLLETETLVGPMMDSARAIGIADLPANPEALIDSSLVADAHRQLDEAGR